MTEQPSFDNPESGPAEDEFRRRNRLLAGINRVFREALTCESDAEIARACLTVAEDLTGSKFGLIGEVNPEGRFDTIALSDPGWKACRIAETEAVVSLRDMEIRGMLGRAILQGESAIVNDAASAPDRLGAPEGHAPIHCFLAVPLKQADRTVGQIALANREGGYDQRHLEEMEALGVAFVEALYRKRAETALRESEERFRAIADYTYGLEHWVSPEGRLLWVNPAVERVSGYTVDECLAMPDYPMPFVHEEDRERMQDLCQHALGGSSGNDVPFRLRRKDGTVIWAACSWQPIFGSDGVCLGCRASIRDITQRKQAEEQLRRAHAELETRVAERTAELARANERLQAEIAERNRAERALKSTVQELERSNEDLRQFAYAASHDLQEPLRAVGGFVRLLQERYQAKLDATAQEYIEFAVGGVTRMQRLIDALLSYCHVGTYGKPFEPVDSNQALDEALANLEAAIAEQAATVTWDELPTVTADPTQLMQLFQNLIGNAIKFRGREPPQVHVSARRTDGEWTFSVRDNGLGIAPKHADRVFILFRRLHESETYPGTGVGLTICKRIVERHGGRIWFESDPGKGTTFYFTIPAEKEKVSGTFIGEEGATS